MSWKYINKRDLTRKVMEELEMWFPQFWHASHGLELGEKSFASRQPDQHSTSRNIQYNPPPLTMSTIASPRPSITLSSRRTSATSADTNVRSSSTSRAPIAPTQRRNRAALREFYNLKPSELDPNSSKEALPTEDAPPTSELDNPSFDAASYVKNLLAHEGLEGVLRVEAGLLADIRGFDGERKALVYDNYSKLIAATDTIRKMRSNMDPLAPTTHTLTPAMAHIAQTADSLSAPREKASEADEDRERQRRTVRWVLDAPVRLRRYLADGKEQVARADFERVSKLLDRWGDVAGVEVLRTSCQEILQPAA